MDKITYNERKSKGLCPACGQPANDGYVTCKSCRNARQKKKEAKKLLGLCVDCNAPTKKGTNLCEKCSKKACEIKRKQREERKSQGLCTRCGEKAVPGFTNCESCKAYSKELREMYIRSNICSYCHKEPVYGEDKVCSECKLKLRKTNANYRKSHRQELREKENARQKREYAERKEKGICIRCGKNKASDGRFTCLTCREKNNKRKRLTYEKILVDRPNRCRYCNNDSAPGYKVCEEHRQRLSASATSKNVNEARKKTRARLNW